MRARVRALSRDCEKEKCDREREREVEVDCWSVTVSEQQRPWLVVAA